MIRKKATSKLVMSEKKAILKTFVFNVFSSMVGVALLIAIVIPLGSYLSPMQEAQTDPMERYLQAEMITMATSFKKLCDNSIAVIAAYQSINFKFQTLRRYSSFKISGKYDKVHNQLGEFIKAYHLDAEVTPQACAVKLDGIHAELLLISNK